MLVASLNLLLANAGLVVLLVAIAFLTVACSQNLRDQKSARRDGLSEESTQAAPTEVAAASTEDKLPDSSPSASTEEPLPTAPNDPSLGGGYARDRAEMVSTHLGGRDISNSRVLEAMARVPRHRFVPLDLRHRAYADSPLPIGHGQTISQPYIVALMTQLVDPQPSAKALDVGTGSGYQAAVLAELVGSVYSIEIVEPLAEQAKSRLETLGYDNVYVRHGDGYRGWPEEAPFDIIVVAAAPDHVPQPLVDQLAAGGKMVIPVGRYFQNLLILEKAADGTVSQHKVAPVAFVPMTGEAEQ